MGQHKTDEPILCAPNGIRAGNKGTKPLAMPRIDRKKYTPTGTHTVCEKKLEVL